jgi:hypothetical protein
VAKDVVAGKISLGIRSPDQIDERLLANPGKDGLQSGRHIGREYVMSKDFYRGRVIPLELSFRFSLFLDHRDYGGAIKICFLPLKGVVDELRGG